MTSGGGKLVLVGTPLGNREDLSPRARRVLTMADLLLCEDTRSPTRLLGAEVSLPPKMSCFVGNEASRVDKLLAALAAGKTVAFVSEAGLPVWSDPGARLVRAAVGAGYEVDVVPAATAGSVALCLSGFAAEGATFCGFLPRSGGERTLALERVARARGPTIIYEAGNRVRSLLHDLAAVVPDATTLAVVLARELTKLHQEVRRGSLAQLAAELAESLRGEVTVVVDAAASPSDEVSDAQKVARGVLDLMLDRSLRPRERARQLAALTDLAANDIYARLMGDRSSVSDRD